MAHSRRPSVRGSGPQGLLTPELIKQHSGQYDMDTVGVLHYTGRGGQKDVGLNPAKRLLVPEGLAHPDLTRITTLEECVNVLEINFTDNAIERIEGLDTLTILKKLVLTNNKITKVENLEKLEGLEHLLLQGNQISSLADVNCPLLQTLPKLVSLYLKNVDGSQANPVCKEPSYRASILSKLPNLRNLDGERLRSAGQNAFQEAANKHIEQEHDEVDVLNPLGRRIPGASFVPPSVWYEELEDVDSISFTVRDKELRSELNVCRTLNEKAIDLIAEYKQPLGL